MPAHRPRCRRRRLLPPVAFLPLPRLPPNAASRYRRIRCREERYYDREEVLGRDAASVFPTEARKAAAAGAAGLAELLGANKKFISETEVGAVRSGGRNAKPVWRSRRRIKCCGG